MRDGFLKVAAATPEVRVADCAWNRAQTAELMRQAAEQGVKVVCFPELGLTGYTCADLFLQSTLLRGAERALEELMAETKDLDLLACVGVPVRVRGKLYNCAAVFCRGELLGLVPKTNIPNYTEFYEGRWFTGGAAFGDTDFCIAYAGQEGVEFSTALVFRCASFPALTVGVEICEDVWVADTPSTRLCAGGATLILNPSASDEIVSKAAWRRTLLSATSGRLACGYVYADAGWGESSTDLIYAGHDLILENGSLLAERRFGTGLTVSEIDLEKLEHERQRMNTFPAAAEVYPVYFELEEGETALTRYVDPNPFVPADRGDREERCAEILRLSAQGLAKRLKHTNAKTAVVGLSRRSGLHAGHSHYRHRLRPAGPGSQGHPGRHHALLRHHRPHPGQRRAFWPSELGAPAEARGHRRGGETVTSGTSARAWTTTPSPLRTDRPGSAPRC